MVVPLASHSRKARSLLASPGLGGHFLFELGLVVVAGVALALARCHYSDFVSPVLIVGALKLHSLSP